MKYGKVIFIFLDLYWLPCRQATSKPKYVANLVLQPQRMAC